MQVVLEPMRTDHVNELWTAASDPRIWELAHGPRSLQEMRSYVDQALAEDTLAFVIRPAASGEIVGSTRLKHIDRTSQCCELGNTWLIPELWRTGANRHSKLMLLTMAFEALGMYRVELRAGAQNWRSREALLRLGATEEGTLRSIQPMPSGERRDHVVFSILLPEWEEVRAGLAG